MRENPHLPHDADLAATFAAILFQTPQDALDRVCTHSSSFGVTQRNRLAYTGKTLFLVVT